MIGDKCSCPDCDGKGRYRRIASKSGRGQVCTVCGGTGIIESAHAERIKTGQTMLSERIARGELLFDAAKRLGMTPAQLSAIESGREWREPMVEHLSQPVSTR